MKATRDGKFVLVERTETDKPVVEEPYPRPAKPAPGEFHSWRSRYPICFDTEEEAIKALERVLKLNDFDKAAAWLDKQ